MYRVLFLITIYCILKQSNIHALDEIKYYEKLINETISKQFEYETPTDSSLFMNVNSSDDVYDLGVYDFIIIGAGSAGTVIANRLSENRSWKILLLEAGKNETDFSEIPTMSPSLRLTEMDWGYLTTPQKNACLGVVDQRCMFPRGKVLGGTSAINGMAYARGNRHDYNMWEKMGNGGWAYENVLPYFLKSENSNIGGDVGYHNIGGLLNVEYPHPTSPLLKTFIDANEELGRPIVDYNGKEQLGVARIQYNTIKGRRHSGNKAFLVPAQNRWNLRIISNTLVLKILINPRTKTAYGVKFIRNGTLYKAAIKKEVILSAGVINSPQLLMLSGVGPSAHLRDKGITIIHNLSGVGKNFHDHVAFGIVVNINYTEPDHQLQDLIADYLQGMGAFTYLSNMQGIHFIQTNKSVTEHYPNIELLLLTPNGVNLYIPSGGSYTQEVIENYFMNINLKKAVYLYLILLHPESRGTVSLATNSPYDYPLIDPNYFSVPQDIETMYSGVQDVLTLIKTKAFRRYNATLLDYNLPACKNFLHLSKDYWLCTLRQLSGTSSHSVGSCKMGSVYDPESVVDETLKVHGINNLRVADASVMPFVTSGHTNAPTYMIGEKVSDMIKAIYS